MLLQLNYQVLNSKNTRNETWKYHALNRHLSEREKVAMT